MQVNQLQIRDEDGKNARGYTKCSFISDKAV
jgi:hypothetical protein